MKIDPLDALDSAINAALLYSKFNRQCKATKPGDVIKSLSKESGEALSRLTSDTLASLRIDPLMIPVYETDGLQDKGTREAFKKLIERK